MRKLAILILLVHFHLYAIAQKQGIRGQVFWLSGNQMPGPDKNASPHHGIEREIHIYNAVLLQQTQHADGYFRNIDAVYVGKVKSSADGTFTIKLPPGRYSLFTKEEKGLFASLFDENGCVNCVVVRPRKFSWATITVDYEAAY